MRDDEFKRRSVSAVKWSAAGTTVQFTLQFAVQVVLARILGPEKYGIFAMGFLAVTLCNLLCEGLSWGIVQATEVSREESRAIFTWQVLFGVSVTLALGLAAHPIASWFHEERVGPVLQWLSLIGVLTALASTPVSLLKRELDLRYLNITKVASYATGYIGIGLPMAWSGHGVYSLVAAALAQALSVVILVWIRLPHKLLPLFWHRSAVPLAATGLTAVGTNMCNWSVNNLDRLVLGRMLPAASMGTYTVGSNLANIPGTLLLSSLQPAFLVAGARIQDNRERLRRAYLSILSTIWVIVTPLFMMLALLAPDLVALLYGSAWQTAGNVLAILALAMPAYITWGLSTPVLWNTGKKHFEALLQMPVLATAGIAFFVCAHSGILVLATIAAGSLLARGLITAVTACRQLDIGMRELWPSIFRGVLTTVLAAAITWPAAQSARSMGGHPLLVLVIGGGAGAFVLLLTAYRFPSLLGPRVLEMLGRFSMPLQAALAGARHRD